MSFPTGAEAPVDPDQARVLARVRWLMILSGATMIIGIAAIFGVIGYRVFKSEGSGAVVDVTAQLPKGARVVATAAAGDRLVVTIEVGGSTEVRTFDLKTLQPSGRLRFAPEP